MKLILVILVLIASSAFAQIDSCPQIARDACAIYQCAECEIINGEPACTTPVSSNSRCVSPCLDQNVTIDFDSIVSIAPGKPCAKFNPVSSAFVTDCFQVSEATECVVGNSPLNIDVGDGPVGRQCAPFQLNLPENSDFFGTPVFRLMDGQPFPGGTFAVPGIPICPPGFQLAIPFNPGNFQFYCIDLSAPYTGPSSMLFPVREFNRVEQIEKCELATGIFSGGSWSFESIVGIESASGAVVTSCQPCTVGFLDSMGQVTTDYCPPGPICPPPVFTTCSVSSCSAAGGCSFTPSATSVPYGSCQNPTCSGVTCTPTCVQTGLSCVEDVFIDESQATKSGNSVLTPGSGLGKFQFCPNCINFLSEPAPASCDFDRYAHLPLSQSSLSSGPVGQPDFPGTCVAGVCTGPWDTDVVGSNVDNEQCKAGYCRPVFIDPEVDLTNPDLYPTETCNPLCPGWPNCTSECAGWPNAVDGLSLLRPEVSEAPLNDGEECRNSDFCVGSAICIDEECVPTSSRNPACERLTCRMCERANGTCFGPPAPAGTPCRVGCLVDNEGVCDGSGNCVGTPVSASFCETIVGTGLLAEPQNLPCYETACIPTPPAFATSNQFLAARRVNVDGQPLVPAFVTQEEIDNAVDALYEELSTCGLNATFAPCDDSDACTQGDMCGENFLCSSATETRSYCRLTQCAECNAVTGLCEGQIDFPGPCFSQCAIDGTPEGFCISGQCRPFFPNETACSAFNPDPECTDAECTTVYTGGATQIPSAPGQPSDYATLSPFLEASCDLTATLDNFPCSTQAGRDDNCVISETCQSGVCLPAGLVNCAFFFSGNPCVNVSASLCNSQTGVCDPVPIADGTPCPTADSCTENGQCLTLPGQEPECVGTPAIDCDAIAAADQCIQSAVCDGSGMFPQCVSVFEPLGVTCTLSNPGLCAPFGQCDGQGGCQPIATQCPPSTNQCQVPVCNPTSGLCGFENVPDTQICDDLLTCTTDDQCISGQCTGTPIDCTPDVCKVSLGCTEPNNFCEFEDAPDNTTCPDGLCISGVCVLQCEPECQGGGVCVGVNPTQCDCPFGRTGQFCQIVTDEIDNDLDITLQDRATDIILATGTFIGLTGLFAALIAYIRYCTQSNPRITVINSIKQD